MPNIVTHVYTRSQIALHWLIAVMVLFQLLFGEEMAHANRALDRGLGLTTSQVLQMNLHIWVGFAILAAVLVRIAMRLRFGAPVAPHGESRLIQALGRTSHHLFYLLLVAVPATGIIGYYWLPALNDVHTLGKPAFIVLITLHIVAALWHQFYRCDGLLLRMLRPIHPSKT